MTASIRLNALYWAILVNYSLYVLITIFVIITTAFKIHVTNDLFGSFTYWLDFTTYNLFTPLVIFIVLFYYQLYRSKNEFTVKPLRLLPHKPYRFIGKWLSVAIILFIVIGWLLHYESFEAGFIFLPFTLLLYTYSKNKVEDEYIDSLRLEAMQVAVYVNYGILLLLTFLVYGFEFLELQEMNLFTIPLIFIIWFQYKLYRTNKQAAVIKTFVL